MGSPLPTIELLPAALVCGPDQLVVLVVIHHAYPAAVVSVPKTLIGGQRVDIEARRLIVTADEAVEPGIARVPEVIGDRLVARVWSGVKSVDEVDLVVMRAVARCYRVRGTSQVLLES